MPPRNSTASSEYPDLSLLGPHSRVGDKPPKFLGCFVPKTGGTAALKMFLYRPGPKHLSRLSIALSLNHRGIHISLCRRVQPTGPHVSPRDGLAESATSTAVLCCRSCRMFFGDLQLGPIGPALLFSSVSSRG